MLSLTAEINPRAAPRNEKPVENACAGIKGTVPTLLDVVVTRDPAKRLPGVDSRTLEVKPGDRPV